MIAVRLNGPARRLTVLVDEGDRAPHSHKPLYYELVHLAHESRLAGATVHRGIEGFGASRHVHVNRILSLSPNLPVAVIIVDTPGRIDAFLPPVQTQVTDGLITVEDVRAIGHARQGDAEDVTAPAPRAGLLRWGTRQGTAPAPRTWLTADRVVR